MTGASASGHREEVKRTLVVLVCALFVGLTALLLPSQPSWARPDHNRLRQTIATPVPPPTKGPTSTGTPTRRPGTQRVLLQQDDNGYTGTSDTWIDSYTDRYPKPLLGGLRVKGSDIQATLIRFDLEGRLPPDANVTDAELVFFVEVPAFQVARALDVSAFRVLREWEESQASWDYVDSAGRIPWGAAGCDAPGTDRSDIPDDTITLFHTAVYRGFNVAQSVRHWLEHPAENFGWLIQGVSASTGVYGFDSSRSSEPAQRPILRIDYTSDGTTPTMTTTPGGSTSTPTATETQYTPTTTATAGGPTSTPTPTAQPTTSAFEAVQDTYIDSWEPTDAHDLQSMQCRSNGIRKPLVQFDLSSLRGDAHVVSATLHLTTGPTGAPASVDVAAHRLFQCWQEVSATWEESAQGQLWAAAGASGAADYDAGPLDTVSVDAVSQEYAWDVTLAAQAWVQGGEENCGLILIGQPGTQAQWSFLSSEAPGAAGHPQLLVHYYVVAPTSTPTVTPTPTLEQGSILVTVFEDTDRNGWHDPGEGGLAGVAVELLADFDRQVLAQKTSASDGTCAFPELSAGWYRLREHNRWGFVSSTPDEVRVLVDSGQTLAFFGDYAVEAVALPMIYSP